LFAQRQPIGWYSNSASTVNGPWRVGDADFEVTRYGDPRARKIGIVAN